MKVIHIKTLLFLFITTLVSAQEINQFDANGKRQGVWKKTFEGTKAVRYEGQFKNGKEVGLFKFYKFVNKKSVLSGTKQFNKTNNLADVKFFTSKGKVISEGQMEGKKYIGTWNYYHKNSKQLLSTEQFDNNGLQQGELLVYYENGTIAERSNYIDGKLEGNSVWYNEKGIAVKEFIFENDELHGLSKYSSNEGELLIEGVYRRGKKHGIWKYYQNGKLKEEKDFTRRSKNPYKKQ